MKEKSWGWIKLIRTSNRSKRDVENQDEILVDRSDRGKDYYLLFLTPFLRIDNFAYPKKECKWEMKAVQGPAICLI